jgi:serine/threonine-protein kinase
MLRDLARIAADEPALPAPLAAAEPATMGVAGAVVPSRRPARPRRRPSNRARSWVWGRSAAIVALVAGALAASGLGGYTVWRSSADSASARTGAGQAPEQGLGAGTSVAAQPAPSAAGLTPAPIAPAAGIMPDAAQPADAAAGSSSRAPDAPRAGATAGPASIGASIGPGGGRAEVVFGPWQCGEPLSWSVGHPVLAKPCHAIGGAIRVVGHMEAGPGVQADISLSVRDAGTGELAAGPYTCEAKMFTDFALKHTCGPVDLKAPHGHRYVVEESWVYTGRSLLPGGTARGREFTW